MEHCILIQGFVAEKDRYKEYHEFTWSGAQKMFTMNWQE